jgi:maltose alpha-D-glucosyltransferase / alpha-amylase
MLEVRREHPVFGTGGLEVVSTENPSVLAYVRSMGEPNPDGPGPDGISPDGPGGGPGAEHDGELAPGDVVLCISNLSRFAQPAQLPLQRWEGMTPIELIGRVPFPAIGAMPYFITLPPYGFYWFGLVGRRTRPTGG